MAHSMDAREAIRIAIAELDDADDRTPEINEAIGRLQEILDQRGCDVFGALPPGKDLLTDFIDVVIDG